MSSNVYSFPYCKRLPVNYINPELVSQIDYLMWTCSQQAAAVEAPGVAYHFWQLPFFFPPNGRVEDTLNFVAGIPMDYTTQFLAMVYGLKQADRISVDSTGQIVKGTTGYQMAGKFALEYLETLHKAYLARYAEPIKLLLMATRRRQAHADEFGPLANVMFFIDDCVGASKYSVPQK